VAGRAPPDFEIFPFFRAAFAIWTSFQGPSRPRNRAAWLPLRTLSENNEAGAAVNLAAAAALPNARNNVAEFAARSISAAVRAEPLIAEDTLQEIVEVDGVGDFDARSRAALARATKPLWRNQMVPRVADVWAALRNRMLSEGDDWDVWVDWYEDRLAGRPSLSENFDNDVNKLPNQLWESGPKAVNAFIKELIAAHSPITLPAEASLPVQTSRAAIFQPEPTGIIGVAPPTALDRISDTDEVRDLYGETREKLDALISLGRNMLGDRLDRTSRRLQSRMPEDVSEAVERLVWSSGNTLRSILAAHDAVRGDRDLHPDKLDNGAAERLRDAVGTFNQLAVADPSLRRRDGGRPGPQEHARTLDEIKIVVEVVAEAASNRNITTQPAGEQLSENATIADEAGASLVDRLAVELTRDTDRNFVAGMVTSAYGMLRRLPALARGEGGFISKEFFGGFYKYTGGAAAVAVAGAAVEAYAIRWEIIEFIVSNADQFRLYAAYAFEQSPGFKQMIDWLEAHVRIEK